jgi:hypothetical protein
MALSLFPSIDERISDWIESKRRDQIEHRKRLNCFTITLSREFGSTGISLKRYGWIIALTKSFCPI